MNAKQRDAIARVQRDQVRLEKSIEHLAAVFMPATTASRGMKITQGKAVDTKKLAPYYSTKGRKAGNGMSAKGGQK